MRKQKSLGKNAVLNTINTLTGVLFPLITYPYATRVIGAEGIGKITYTNSIVQYFMYIAALGVTTYAVREGSRIREEKNKINILITDLFITNLLTTSISFITLLCIAFFVSGLSSYNTIFLILSLNVILETLSLDWINNIYEDYLYLTIRSIAVHIISILGLFLLVHTREDLYYYAALLVVPYLGKFIPNWIRIFKAKTIHFERTVKIIHHLKGMILFFANNIAVLVYVNADITMLGMMTTDTIVGYYAVSSKIYSIVKSILAGIYVVTIPRLSLYASKETRIEFSTLLASIIDTLMVLLIPAVVGMFILSPEIIHLISGSAFARSANSLRILSIALFFAIFGGILSQCALIPLKEERKVLCGTIVSAILNIALNVLLIPALEENGAAITTVIAEAFVVAFCLPWIRKYNLGICRKKSMVTILQSIVGSMLFIPIIYVFRALLNNSLVILGMSISLCALEYFILLRILHNPVVIKWTKELLRLVKK